MPTYEEWIEVFGADAPRDDDSTLAHYTTTERAAGLALLKQLVLSPLAFMNDPRESQDRGVVTMSVSDRKEVPEHVDADALSEKFWSSRKKVRMSSFTADGGSTAGPGSATRFDERCFARQRMWAQYGGAQAGLCLLLDRQRLQDAASDTFGAKARCGPVEYMSGFDRSAVVIAGPGNDPWRAYSDEALFRKNSDWASEREFRVRVEDWGDTDCLLPLDDVVIGLVLGPAFPAHQLPLAQAVADAFDVAESTAQVLMSDGGVLTPYPVYRSGRWNICTDVDSRASAIFDS